MRAIVVSLTFLAGAAIAASTFWIGRELGPAGAPRLGAPDDPSSKKTAALDARMEDLEARLDAVVRASAPAVVRSEDPNARDAGAPRAGAAPVAGANGALPAAANANAFDRGPGFEQLRALRDAPDDATRLKLARELLKDENPMASLSALRVLADLSPKEALATVDQWVAGIAAGDVNSWQVDRAIATLLDGKGAAALATDLDSKLHDWYQKGDAELKRTTARSLETRGDAGPMQQLVAGYRGDLGNSDIGTRTRAVDSLGRTRSKEAVPVLMPMLADPSEEVRLGALDALRRTGTADAIEKVRPLLDDPVAAVRDRATRTIESLRRGDQQPDWSGFGGADFRGGGGPPNTGGRGGRRGSN